MWRTLHPDPKPNRAAQPLRPVIRPPFLGATVPSSPDVTPGEAGHGPCSPAANPSGLMTMITGNPGLWKSMIRSNLVPYRGDDPNWKWFSTRIAWQGTSDVPDRRCGGTVAPGIGVAAGMAASRSRLSWLSQPRHSPRPMRPSARHPASRPRARRANLLPSAPAPHPPRPRVGAPAGPHPPRDPARPPRPHPPVTPGPGAPAPPPRARPVAPPLARRAGGKSAISEKRG